MEFALSEQQEQLRETARRYLARTYPPERVAALADSTGYAEDGWDPIVRMGWLDPDLGTVELALLAEESGYALHPVPWWSTVGLAVPGTIPGSPTTLAPTTLAPTTLAPTTLAPTTLAWCDERSGSLAEAHRAAACRAQRQPDGGWRVWGTKRLVVDLASASEVVLTAATGQRVALFRVQPSHPTVTVTPCACLDGLRRVAELTCVGTPARQVAETLDTQTTLRRVSWRALALLAAEAVGVARRAFELAAEHARTRTQFGRPIGAYQGVAFRVADSYVALELARSLAYRAAWLAGQVETAAETVDEAVAAATVAGREAAVGCCEHAFQVLGGIAMTWEHPLHRWYRRALWLQAFDAGSARHREYLARTLLEADGDRREPSSTVVGR